MVIGYRVQTISHLPIFATATDQSTRLIKNADQVIRLSDFGGGLKRRIRSPRCEIVGSRVMRLDI